MDNLYKKLSEERKYLQKQGLVPEWYTTAAYQMFKEKYEYDTKDESVKGQFKRIANTAAKHLRNTKFEKEAENKFFEMLWKGWLSPSTPVLANMGTTRGMPVSCSGTIIEDSVDGFYKNLHETAILTKNGFGTATDLTPIRPRGTPISVGGKANGVLPVLQEHIQVTRNVSQGSQRRGAWAGYLDIEHGDFFEVVDFISHEPDDCNIGWIVNQTFITRLQNNNEDAIKRYKRALKVKMLTGKGYFFFKDKANAKRPKMYQDLGLFINNAQLCNEICLFNDEHHTYTCVLSSINTTHWDVLRDSDTIYWATIFLDCVAQEFIEKAKRVSGLEKAVRFTEKGRALGLGQCGWHTLLQSKKLSMESFEAHLLNLEIADIINKESLRASQDLAKELGEPEWCRGYGVRNTHRIAIAPTKSTALLMGGCSEGINADPGVVYTQLTAAGEVDRVIPEFLKLLKERGLYTKKILQDIKDHSGSIQHVDWLSDEEKSIFKTAFEINQKTILRLAATRGKYIDQWQSLNLFFAAEEDEAYISEVHKEAFLNPDILGLYYIYTQAGIQAAKEGCEACQ